MKMVDWCGHTRLIIGLEERMLMVLWALWWCGNLNTDQVFSDLPLLPPHLMKSCIITVSSGVFAPKAQPSCPASAAVSRVCVFVCVSVTECVSKMLMWAVSDWLSYARDSCGVRTKSCLFPKQQLSLSSCPTHKHTQNESMGGLGEMKYVCSTVLTMAAAEAFFIIDYSISHVFLIESIAFPFTMFHSS